MVELGVQVVVEQAGQVARRDRSRDVREAARDILERFTTPTDKQST